MYIDESHFHLQMKKRKGRAIKGEAARLSLLPKGRSLSLIASLLPNRVGAHRFVVSERKKKGVNADDIVLFLNYLVRDLSDYTVVVLDNAKVHHAHPVSTFFEAIKGRNIVPLFLPPYSPFLNPIELGFSKIKNSVQRSDYSDINTLKEAIEEGLRSITSQNIAGWEKHTQRYFSLCMSSEPFTGNILSPDIPDIAAEAPLLSLLPSPSLLALPPPVPNFSIHENREIEFVDA